MIIQIKRRSGVLQFYCVKKKLLREYTFDRLYLHHLVRLIHRRLYVNLFYFKIESMPVFQQWNTDWPFSIVYARITRALFDIHFVSCVYIETALVKVRITMYESVYYFRQRNHAEKNHWYVKYAMDTFHRGGSDA